MSPLIVCNAQSGARQLSCTILGLRVHYEAVTAHRGERILGTAQLQYLNEMYISRMNGSPHYHRSSGAMRSTEASPQSYV